MGIQRDLLKMCHSKQKLKTTTDAEFVGRKVMEKNGIQLYYYYCSNCTNFHLTRKQNKHKICLDK